MRYGLRWLWHRWRQPSVARVLDTPARQRLAQAVQAGECHHTGEVRVCIEAGLPLSYLRRPEPLRAVVQARARRQFAHLGVWDTADNNGVLIYLCLAERAIDIVADRGLNGHVSTDQWRALVDELGAALRAGDVEGGLLRAIAGVHQHLERAWPAAPGVSRVNALPDEPHIV